MAIDPIKIPQNVYIEDRIVGPVTLRQIIIISLGCGFSYAIWAVMARAYGSVPLPLTIMVWIPGLLSVIFAFIKVNDLSMLRLCILFIEKLNKPSKRTWTPRQGISINIYTKAKIEDEEARKKVIPQSQNKQPGIDELTALLDQPMERETEPAYDEEEELTARSTVMRPVDPARIQVSPKAADASLDTLNPARFPSRS